ncbi:hypothetical protein BJX62DRAFT_62948 [Aspergillus germanicus]
MPKDEPTVARRKDETYPEEKEGKTYGQCTECGWVMSLASGFPEQGEYTLARVIPNEVCRCDTQPVMNFLVLAAPDNPKAGTEWMVEVPKCSRADVARFGARFGQLQQRAHNLRAAWLRTVPHPLCSNFLFRRVAAVKIPVWERHRRLYRGRFHIRPSSIKPCHPSEPS